MADPFNKVIPRKAVGMPFHGLVDNGTLTLPNAAQDTISLGTTPYGPCCVLRHPDPPGITRTAAEQQHDIDTGKEWREYALITAQGDLNGHSIGTNNRIYIDPAGTPWLIAFDFGTFDATLTRSISITLSSIFGRFRTPAYTAINRLLDSETLTFPTSEGEYPHHALFTHNEDGSGFKANFYTYYQNAGADNTIRDYVGINTTIYRARQLKKIVTYTIAGTGDTDPASLGDGITGSISVEDIAKPVQISPTRVITRRLDTTTFDNNVITAQTGTIDQGVGGSIFNEVVAEVYEGNSVSRITYSLDYELYRHEDKQLSGTHNCDGTGSTASAQTTLFSKNLRNWTWTVIPGVSGTYGYVERSDDITGASLNIDCTGGDEGFSDNPLPWPDEPELTGSDLALTTCQIQNNAIWFLPSTGDAIYWAPGVSTGTNSDKTSYLDLMFVATNPETGDHQASTVPIAYV